jgi:hypothetical protein
MKFRKKPIIVDAVQWFKNGDHPSVSPTTNKCEKEMKDD